MIHISDIVIPIGKENQIKKIISQKYAFNYDSINYFRIIKKSIDARKKDQIHYIFAVDLSLNNDDEKKLVKKYKNIELKSEDKAYTVNKLAVNNANPVVIGMGPAGLLCALNLAKAGLNPIVIERGEAVENRTATVKKFWDTNDLNPESNVQFGEGGAGTFSDGKLNTGVKDRLGYKEYCLNIFVEHGAKEDILYDSKPHIGTDILAVVVKNIRNEIINLGGKVLFNTKLIDFDYDACIKSVTVFDQVTNETKKINCSELVLAIGHSARDTFLLLDKHLILEQKPFAMGYRVIHTQDFINKSQYGNDYEDLYEELPASPYKLTYNSPNGRGVYSFCMCPGGYVVNASSEEGRCCVNGMSYSGRDSGYANSAIIVQVTPEDYPSKDNLSGMYLQRQLEEANYKLCNGMIPVESYNDFRTKLGLDGVTCDKNIINPNDAIKGLWEYAEIHTAMPEYINSSFIEGMEYFNNKIKGFASSNPLIAGIESRTSSPVKIIRDDKLEANIKGIYPCGEGAGYAGGIISAAMDGVKVADAIINKYKLLEV